MTLNPRRWTIKVRAAITFSALILVLVAGMSLAQLHELRQGFIRVISEQQFSMVRRTAREIDLKLDTGIHALRATASVLAAESLGSPAKLRERLAAQGALMALFDDVLVAEVGGRVVSDLPEVPGRIGLDLSARDFFREVATTGAAAISEPFEGRLDRAPLLQIGVPILEGERLRGVLVGVIRLKRPTLLGNLSEQGLGRSGLFMLVTRGERPVYLAHPDSSRLLTERVADASDVVGRAAKGFEGTAEGVSLRGVETLYSSAQLKRAPWVLIAAAPRDEVFAALHAAEQRVLALSALAATATALLGWLAALRLLAPLKRLRDAMVDMRSNGRFVEVPVERHDEVGALTRAFNGLMLKGERDARSLLESEHRLATLADNLPVLVSYLDRDLRVRFANSCYHDWFGIRPEAMLGQRPDETFGSAAFDDIRPHLQAALDGYPATFEREIMTLNGPRITRTVVRPCMDDSGRVLGIYRMTSDVSADRRLQTELARLAHVDALTGLANRRAFEEALELALARARRDRRWLALLFVDLDRFKAVNDTLGHGAGDDALREVASRLRNCVRVTDTVARMGGDEFVLILEGLHSVQDAALVADKVITEIGRPIDTRDGECSLGASIGIATCASGVVDGAELVRRADEAAYQAKRAGGDRRSMAPAEAPALRDATQVRSVLSA